MQMEKAMTTTQTMRETATDHRNESYDEEGARSRRALWGGRMTSGLAVAFLAFDGAFKLIGADEAIQASAQLGWTAEQLPVLGVIQLLCLGLYLVPRTAILGAVLWTGYLGGAVATHLRVDSPLISHTLFPIYVAALLWVGLWLRDARLRAVLPLG